MAQQSVWEGTWEELSQRASEFAGTGRKMKLIVISDEDVPQSSTNGLPPAAANAQMLSILREIEERHRDRPYTDGSDTRQLLRAGRAGAERE